MNIRRTTDLINKWESKHQDPANWLPVNSSHFSSQKKDKYMARKKALELYLTSDLPIEKIIRRVGVSKTELYRIVHRAFEAGVDGNPIGFLACIPGYRVKKYKLTTFSSEQKAGKMDLFLSQHPELKKQLDDWALGKKALNQATLRGNYYKQLWLAFMKISELAGIQLENEYPFTNADGGREAIRRYVIKLRESNFIANATVLHGSASGRLARDNGVRTPEPTTIPYDRVQLDGHKIDAVFTAVIQGADGNLIELPLSRIWLLVLIDLGSRCVLGYHLSLSENYTSEDVLNCIGTSLEPWEPKELPEQVKGYRKDAGLPSGVIKACQWRIFNTMQMDNAYAHLSSWVQERIINAGALEVVTNKPASPRSDSIVERFMETFEEISMHQWPNTTGSSPQDARRRDPEKAAKKLCIGFEELQVAADLAVSDYNATAHTSLHGRSPMEYLRHRLSKGIDLVRFAPKTSLDGLSLFERDFKVTIRANLKQGHKPYVKFLNVRYSQNWLQSRFDLNGLKATLRVNTRDIRNALLFLETGECLGEISAEANWMEHPHTIAMRRAIGKLVRAKKLQSDSYQPVSDYLAYLAQQAPITRKARNALLKNEKAAAIHEQKPTHSEERCEQGVQYKPRTDYVHLTRTITT